MSEQTLSIVLPAKNEAVGLEKLLPELKEQQPQAEIIVVMIPRRKYVKNSP